MRGPRCSDGEAQNGGQQDDLSELGIVFELEALAECNLQPVGKGFIFIFLMKKK